MNAPQEFERLKWLNAKEAADFLRTSVPAIRNLVWRRRLFAYKPNGRLLFRKSDLDRLIEGSRKGEFR